MSPCEQWSKKSRIIPSIYIPDPSCGTAVEKVLAQALSRCPNCTRVVAAVTIRLYPPFDLPLVLARRYQFIESRFCLNVPKFNSVVNATAANAQVKALACRLDRTYPTIPSLSIRQGSAPLAALQKLDIVVMLDRAPQDFNVPGGGFCNFHLPPNNHRFFQDGVVHHLPGDYMFAADGDPVPSARRPLARWSTTCRDNGSCRSI